MESKPTDVQTQAENALVTSILSQPQIAAQCLENLDFPTSCFSRPYITCFVESFVELFGKGLTPDYTTIIIDLSKKMPPKSNWLSKIAEILDTKWGASENAGFYLQVIRDEIKRSKTEGIREWAVKEIQDGKSVDVVNAKVQSDLECIESSFGGSDSPNASFRKSVEELIARIQAREQPKDIIRTGFKKIDELAIGYAPGDYIIFAARPSVGKTAIAANILVNLAMEGIRTCFHSLEQSNIQVANRILANVADISTRKSLRRTNELPDWAQEKMLSKAEVLRHIADMVAVYDRPGRTIEEISLDSRAAVKAGAKMIVIDYVQLIRSTKKAENRNLEVTHISMELKALFRSLKVPGIVLCQLSRGMEKENRSPMLSDLRESGSLEQDADYVCFLHGEKKALETSGWRRFIQAKGRDAGVGWCDLWFRKETTTYFDEEPGGEV